MAVSVSFGKTDRDNRWLEKSPTWKATNVSCDIYGGVDRINPALLVDTSQVNLDDTNYMHIPEFGRYYFITSIVGNAGHSVVVNGHVDVLMTYQDSIRRCKCIAERSTSNYNFYLNDPRRLFNAYCYNDFQFVGGSSVNADIGAPNSAVLITVG